MSARQVSVIGDTSLRFDEEQAMLFDYARGFCSERGGVAAAREHLEGEREYAPALWQDIVAMGWTGIGLPESVGGTGMGIGSAVAVLENMGRAMLGTPLMSTLLAAQLLLRADAAAAEPVLRAIAGGSIATVAELESEDWFESVPKTYVDDSGLLQGCKRLVMDALGASWMVVSAQRGGEIVLVVVAGDALPKGACTPRVMLDNTHRAADVRFENIKPVAVIEGPSVHDAMRDYRLIGALLVAAESTGAAAQCLDTITDYLKTRRQFGKLIGSYQALKHPSVDILTSMDSARSFCYHAATLLAELQDKPSGASERAGMRLDREAEVACRMAKAQATDALKHAGDRAVQFHGGMGFTWDCDAQLFIRRAQWAQQQFGDAQHHRQELARLLLG